MGLTVQAIQRLPYYLQYLKKLKKDGVDVVSATAIANELGLNDVQVRKDIAAVSTSKGKPKVGFHVEELIHNIECYLGYDNTSDAVLIGVGSLGRALLSSSEFEKYGLNIVGSEIAGKKILDISKLNELCRRMHIHIGIITVPAESAQRACDELVSCGIKAIWNFALKNLAVPAGVLVKNENLAASLAVLSQHLREEIARS